MISDELGARLATHGFAIPGMEDVARDARSAAATSTAVCGADVACIDWASIALSPLGIGLLALVFFLAGESAASDTGTDVLNERLEEQARRSRQRRNEQLKAYASRLKPLQNSLGWQLIDGEGFPTADAWLFLAIALAAQLFVGSLLYQVLPTL